MMLLFAPSGAYFALSLVINSSDPAWVAALIAALHDERIISAGITVVIIGFVAGLRRVAINCIRAGGDIIVFYHRTRLRCAQSRLKSGGSARNPSRRLGKGKSGSADKATRSAQHSKVKKDSVAQTENRQNAKGSRAKQSRSIVKEGTAAPLGLHDSGMGRE